MKLEELIIKLTKEFLKCSPVIWAMFADYGCPLSHMEDIPISFSDLPVSAKTKGKCIYLNKSLISDGWEEDIHYVVHELCHYLQQYTGDVKEYKDLADKDYLDKPTELEAFSYQVQFMRDHYGEDIAEEYIENLLDFHKYSGEERKEKKRRLWD